MIYDIYIFYDNDNFIKMLMDLNNKSVIVYVFVTCLDL